MHVTLIRTNVDSVITYYAFLPWENWAIPAVFAMATGYASGALAGEAARQRSLNTLPPDTEELGMIDVNPFEEYMG